MNRSWAEYKVGFGERSGNYWLGNDLLDQLTANYRYKLRSDLLSRDTGNWYYAEYSTFRVMSEADNYTLLVNGYSGNAGYDAFSLDNVGAKFTTINRENDRHPSFNCAARFGGGFWWRDCGGCLVNAARGTGGFFWVGLPRGRYSLQLSRIWLQCK